MSIKWENPGLLPNILYYLQRFKADGNLLYNHEIGMSEPPPKKLYWSRFLIREIETELKRPQAKWGKVSSVEDDDFLSLCAQIQKAFDESGWEELSAIQLFVWSLCDELVKVHIRIAREILGKKSTERKSKLTVLTKLDKKFDDIASIEGVMRPLTTFRDRLTWKDVSNALHENIERIEIELSDIVAGNWPNLEMGKQLHSKGKPKIYANWCIHLLFKNLVNGGLTPAKAKMLISNLYGCFGVSIRTDDFLARFKKNPVKPIFPEDFFFRLAIIQKLLEL